MGKYTDVSHDGMEAFTTYGEGPGFLQWGGSNIPLTIDGINYHGLYLSFALVDNPLSVYHNKHIAVMQCLELPNTAIFVVCEDELLTLVQPGAYGTNPCLVSNEGNIVYQISGFTYTYNGVPWQIPLPDGTSQGFAYFNEDGSVTWMDEVIGHNSPTYGGWKFVRAYVIDGWVFGQSLEDTVIAYQMSTGKVFLVKDIKTEVAPRGNVINGAPVCAISEPGMFVYYDEFVLISDPPPTGDPFKQQVLDKLHQSLNNVEIAYLIQLVERDM